ncbi:MAG TPA: glycosyltransferase [Candidatus Hydrogenedentes bacterium]|nr:glycosyltransferase [Candidatus Hydrogenedentota bacterium]
MPRFEIGPAIRARLGGPRFAGKAPRLLVFRGEYWIDTACVRAARALGWQCESVPVPMVGHFPREGLARLVQTLVDFTPDFVLTANLSGLDTRGILAALFRDLRIPLVTWFVDDPRTILMNSDMMAFPEAIAFTWDAAYLPYLQERGFGQTAWLPLAADIFLFNAESAESWALPPTFVANSMTGQSEEMMNRLRAMDQRTADRLEQAFARDLVTRERFAEGVDALLEDGLPPLPPDPELRRAVEMAAFVEGTRRLRVNLARTLCPLGLRVRGDADWSRYLPPEYCGPYVNYEADLPAFYRDCPVNLNATSLQMPRAVNQRVFECPAAGGFLITDAQPDLFALFEPGTEMICWHTPAECADLFKYYLSHPDERIAIARRARDRVLRQHTYQHRLLEMERLLRQYFS